MAHYARCMGKTEAYLVQSLKSSLQGLCSSLSRHPATTSRGTSGRWAADWSRRQKQRMRQTDRQRGTETQREVCVIRHRSKLNMSTFAFQSWTSTVSLVEEHRGCGQPISSSIQYGTKSVRALSLSNEVYTCRGSSDAQVTSAVAVIHIFLWSW